MKTESALTVCARVALHLLLGILLFHSPPTIGQVITLPSSGLTATIVNDPVTGWNIQGVASSGSGTIPIENALRSIPIWQLRVFDGTSTSTLVTASDNPAGGSRLLTTGTTGSSINFFRWQITWPSGNLLSSLDVVMWTDAGTYSEEIRLLAGYSITPGSSPISVSRFEFPRLAIGGPTQSKRDKLYAPLGEGSLLSNFTDSGIVFSKNEEFFHHPTQIWGAYVTQAGPLTLDHDLSASQLLFFGSRDTAGWAKSTRVSPIVDIALGNAILWVGGNVPSNNLTVSTSSQSYSHFNPSTGSGYVWTIGALASGSSWYDLCSRYRQWAESSAWQYDGEAPSAKLPLEATNSSISSLIKRSGLMIIHQPVEFDSNGCKVWSNHIVPDVRGFSDLFNTSGNPISSNWSGVLELSYGHLEEASIIMHGMEKLVDMANLSLLTPYSNAQWRNEMTGLAALSDVSSAVYTYGMGWDVRAGSWGGANPLAPPLLGTSVPCSTYPMWTQCLASAPASFLVPGIGYSYQVVANLAGNLFHTRDACDEIWLMCPRSTTIYRDAYWGSIFQYSMLLRAATGGPIRGAYLDNMLAPDPLCYYSPLTTDPYDQPHAHPQGGGSYWMAGRRELMRLTRDGMRLLDSEAFVIAEQPTEHWDGVVDMRGSYIRGSIFDPGSVVGNYDGGFEISTPLSVSTFPSSFEVAAVPGFNTVFGHHIPSFAWTRGAPELLGFAEPFQSGLCPPSGFCLPAASSGPANLPAPSSGTVHPSALLGPNSTTLCLYNSYAYNAISSPPTSIMACPSISGGQPFSFAFAQSIPYLSCGHVGTIGEMGGANEWLNWLWYFAAATLLQDAFEFHSKVSMLAINFRGHTVYPYHYNPDTAIGGRLVADHPSYLMMRRMHQVRSDWKSSLVSGPRMGQPLVEPLGTWSTDQLAFANRVCRENRDISFASAHAHWDASQWPDTVVVITNWMPWPLSFTIHVRPTAIGFTPTQTVSSILEHVPDITGAGSPPPVSRPVGSSLVSDHVSFTTSSAMQPGEVRVYHVQ